MLRTDIEATNMDLQHEPVPSDQVPAEPHAALPPPGQQTVQQQEHTGTAEEQQAGDIPEPLAQALTSKYLF